MHTTLQPILDLLDEGLRLYRRNFVAFLLLAGVWLIPLAVAVGITLVATRYGYSTLGGLLILGITLLALPLAIYLIVGMSRAALTAQAGQPVRVLAALALHPLRAISMGLFALVFSVAANIAVSIVIFCIVCPFSSALVGVIGGLTSLGGSAALGGLFALEVGLLFVVLMILLYGLILVLSGATYAGLVYGLQAFIQEDLSFGMAFQRGFDLLGYRFGHNLLAFILTSAVFGALAVAVTVAVGTLLPLPLLWLLGKESPVAQGISVSAWLLGLIVVLPLLPIWMALFYQRNLACREGVELEARIESLASNQ